MKGKVVIQPPSKQVKTDLDDEMCDGSASSVCWLVPPQRHRLVVKVHNPFETQMSMIALIVMILPGSLGSLGGL